jgi:hypothetical protein
MAELRPKDTAQVAAIPGGSLLPLQKGADLERLALSLNARFRAILDKSQAEVRAGKVVSSEEVRRLLGLKRAG